ncbi:CBS domain-containing protein [Haloplanus halobius]|uniref:CBS domain-containing protein n=1 Tax=Haloplanus halobius TaxID=2934938 RepID=UPI00200C9DAC|nr:CBS domain-containing protein [Haloplanus sp. XH21]
MSNTPVEAALTGYGRTVSPDASATEAARKLRDADVPILVVEDEGIEGVVTESDFVEMVAETTDEVSVTELMSSPPITASPLTPLSTVADRMRRHGVERVLVVDGGASETPRGTGDSGAPHSSGSRPDADTDGTYWGCVSIRSVAMHFADHRLDVPQNASATTADAAAPTAVTSD